jgi:hypothetical protein
MAPVAPKGLRTPLLLGGQHAGEFLARAAAWALSARVYSERIGAASSVKMCRSIMIKGLEALTLECVLASSRYGVLDDVLGSLGDTYPGVDWQKKARYLMSRALVHGRRRAEEMREVAKTVAEAGYDPVMTRAIVDKQDWAADLGGTLGPARSDPANPGSAARRARSLAEPRAGGRRRMMRRLAPLMKAAACWRQRSPRSALAEPPQRGWHAHLRVANEPNTFDCHASNTFAVLHFVAPHYSTLLRFAPGDYPRIVGGVAGSWEASADRLTWTFRLRDAVRFHDGSLLTSADVKATFDRMREPARGRDLDPSRPVRQHRPDRHPRSAHRGLPLQIRRRPRPRRQWRARGTASIRRRCCAATPTIPSAG